MNIPFIDLKTQYEALKPQIQERIDQVFEHGQYILGPEVRELEERLQEYTRRQALHYRGQWYRGAADRFDGAGHRSG